MVLLNRTLWILQCLTAPCERLSDTFQRWSVTWKSGRKNKCAAKHLNGLKCVILCKTHFVNVLFPRRIKYFSARWSDTSANICFWPVTPLQKEPGATRWEQRAKCSLGGRAVVQRYTVASQQVDCGYDYLSLVLACGPLVGLFALHSATSASSHLSGAHWPPNSQH